MENIANIVSTVAMATPLQIPVAVNVIATGMETTRGMCVTWGQGGVFVWIIQMGGIVRNVCLVLSEILKGILFLDISEVKQTKRVERRIFYTITFWP